MLASSSLVLFLSPAFPEKDSLQWPQVGSRGCVSYFILKVKSHLSGCTSLSHRHVFVHFAVVSEFLWGFVCCLVLRLEARLVILSRAPLWGCGPVWPFVGSCAGTSTLSPLCQGTRMHRKSLLLSRGPPSSPLTLLVSGWSLLSSEHKSTSLPSCPSGICFRATHKTPLGPLVTTRRTRLDAAGIFVPCDFRAALFA